MRRPAAHVDGMRLRLAVLATVLAGCGEPYRPAPAEPSLAVVASAPINGAVGVARAAFVTLTFSAPPNPETITAGTVGLWNGPAGVPVSLALSGATATLTPRSLLELNTVYVVTVSRGVRDTAGTPLTADFRLTFTTKRTATTPD